MSVFLLGLYITFILIRPNEWFLPVLGWELVNYAAIVTLLMSAHRLLSEHKALWALPEVKWAVGLLAGAILSRAYPPWFGGMLDIFQNFGKVIILYVLVVLLAREERSLRFLLWVVFLCVAWMAIHGVMQIWYGAGFGLPGLWGTTPLWRPRPDGSGVWQIRAFGIFNDPNDLCLVFILALPLIWAEFRSSHHPLAKVVCLALLPLVIYGAYLTNSRGGIVGMFGMAAAWAITRAKGPRRWALIAISILVIILGLPARGSQLGLIDTSRVNAWGDGLAGWERHPLFGVGFENFPSLTQNMVAHNSYVTPLAELGLVGYVPFFVLIFLTMLHLRRANSLKHLLPRNLQLHLSALFSASIGYLTAIYFLTRTYNHVLYLLLALDIAAVAIAARDYNLYAAVFGQRRKDLRLAMIFCALSILAMWITIRACNVLAGRG